MDFMFRMNSFKEGEDRKVGRKGDSHSFLGCIWYNSYRLPSIEANDQWWLLRSLIRLFQQYFKEKTSPFGEKENALPSRHRFTGTDDQIQRIALRIASPSSIFARFNLLRIFPVSKPEEMEERDSPPKSSSSPKQKLILKDWNHIIRTVWKSWRIVGSSVSSWKETMLRNKNESNQKKCILLCFSKNSLTCLGKKF